MVKSKKPVINIKDISFTYSNYVEGEIVQKKALDGISLDIYEGEILLIMGPSGSGKTTLLRSLKQEAAPYGRMAGSVLFPNEKKNTAIVFSNPETQLLTTKVLTDLALPMENLSYDAHTQKKRMSEIVSFFGIEHLLGRHPDTLSGGQKQIVALCAQLMTYPDILLLDEPIGQLDPISALEFLDMLRRLNEELGITIVMTEHRPDEAAPLADKVVYMEQGSIVYHDETKQVMKQLWESNIQRRRDFLPVSAKASLYIDDSKPACITPKELKLMASDMHVFNKVLNYGDIEQKEEITKKPVVRIKEMFFSYDRQQYALRNLNMQIEQGEFLCIMGSNGSGKSTLLKVIAGILKPHIGRVKTRYEKIQYMPQDLHSFFTADSIREQMVFEGMDLELFDSLVDKLELSAHMHKHPYDLSSGEQQKAVLACMLLKKPDFIILDEPTKSMDPSLKRRIPSLLKQYGATVVCATHDLEFAAHYASRCVMLFNGECAYSMDARSFFVENRYYTTSLNKALGHTNSKILLFEDLHDVINGGENETDK